MPFFDYVIYPLFAKIGIFKKQLQRISVGLLFAILSFSVATIFDNRFLIFSPNTAANNANFGTIVGRQQMLYVDR